jgi:hypothetical protein
MVVAMMVTASGKHGAGKHHQEQGGGEDLFHAANVARALGHEKLISRPASRDARGSFIAAKSSPIPEEFPLPERSPNLTVGVDWIHDDLCHCDSQRQPQTLFL